MCGHLGGAGSVHHPAALEHEERREQQDHADRDEGVTEVEGGPVARIEEVGHVALPHPVDEVRRRSRRRAARARPAGTGAGRPSGRSRRTSRSTRDPGQDRHRDSPVREERRTRFPCSGRGGCSKRPEHVHGLAVARGCDRTISFVTWSAITARKDDRRGTRATGTARRRSSGWRPRRESRPSVADPTRMSTRRAALAQPRSSRRLQSMHSVGVRAWPRGAPRRSASRTTRHVPYVPVVDPDERRVDLRQHVGGVLLERRLHLPVDRDGPRVGIAGLRHFLVLGERVLIVQVLDRVGHALDAPPAGARGSGRCSLVPLSASRLEPALGVLDRDSLLPRSPYLATSHPRRGRDLPGREPERPG